VPITFPPEAVENGELLAGLPLPDIRGTIGTFYYFATDLSRYEEGNTEMGGILKRLVMDRGVAEDGTGRPQNPVVKAQQRAILAGGLRSRTPTGRRSPISPRVRTSVCRSPCTGTGPERRATIEIDGKSVSLAERRMEQVGHAGFRVNFLVRLHGMVQMFLVRADKELQLYISPVNWRPDKPPVPISYPSGGLSGIFSAHGKVDLRIGKRISSGSSST